MEVLMNQMREKQVWNASGMVGILVSLIIAGIGFIGLTMQSPAGFILFFVCGAIAMILLTGLVIVQPAEGRVVQLFGDYKGSLREPGLRWTLPLSTKESVSLRLRNFESPRLKVNEADGNPIEIAAIIVWKVVDTAQATFNVDMLEKFVEKQTESALRALATKYPYDKHESHKLSLHENIDEVNEQLGHQVSQSLQSAGIEIIEARISHLAYAPEIAAAMLQRQQAQAIIAARQKIVDGAVGMVDMALKKLTQNGIVQLDEERKAAMVSNLLVVLCSERPSQPVLNTGTIY
jgi:regulator of protease activity HflC (stomatin/prohibitin superfamily)